LGVIVVEVYSIGQNATTIVVINNYCRYPHSNKKQLLPF